MLLIPSVMISAVLGAARADSTVLVRDFAAGVPYLSIEVDMKAAGTKVTATLARGGIGHSERWCDMIGRTQPDIAITGTYFGVGTLIPIGDVVLSGKLVHFGGKGTAICVDADNHAWFRTVPDYTHVDWSGCEFALRAGPRLVRDGEPGIRLREEGFQDPGLRRPTGRLAVGITAGGNILLVATREAVSLARWARVVRAAGCLDAMNLDAGPCMGLYYKGRTLIQPHCRLTNLLLIYARRESDAQTVRMSSAR